MTSRSSIFRPWFLRNRFFTAGLLLCGLPGFALSVAADTESDLVSKIKYRQPAEFIGLPKNIIERLEKMACQIPQTYTSETAHNVISGEFAKTGQSDWAVLCSVKGLSRVVVFWGGTSQCPAAFGEQQDSIYLEDRGDGTTLYLRLISPVNETFILRSAEAYGGPTPPPITHEAIDVAYLGKASEVMYCHGEKADSQSHWMWLQGAD